MAVVSTGDIAFGFPDTLSEMPRTNFETEEPQQTEKPDPARPAAQCEGYDAAHDSGRWDFAPKGRWADIEDEEGDCSDISTYSDFVQVVPVKVARPEGVRTVMHLDDLEYRLDEVNVDGTPKLDRKGKAKTVEIATDIWEYYAMRLHFDGDVCDGVKRFQGYAFMWGRALDHHLKVKLHLRGHGAEGFKRDGAWYADPAVQHLPPVALLEVKKTADPEEARKVATTAFDRIKARMLEIQGELVEAERELKEAHELAHDAEGRPLSEQKKALNKANEAYKKRVQEEWNALL